MNQHDLHELKAIRDYPCLTITLPTHRTSPDNKQDPIRVKNLVAEATTRLLGEFSRRDVEPLLKRLDDLVAEIDYSYTLDGLALFASRDTARRFDLYFSPPERVVVDETFFTRDLVRALNRLRRYWVLALSEKSTRLFEATREQLEELTAGSPFPMVHSGPGGGRGLPTEPAINVSQYRDDHHRQFFRAVDSALGTYLADDPLPVALVGVDRYLAFFREVATSATDIIATLTGNHDATSAHDLGRLVWPLVSEGFTARRRQVLDELGVAVGGQRSASTLGEVWRFANEGRGQTLLVEDGYHEPARVGENGLLQPADGTEAGPDVLDDAVDEIVTVVLQKGGRVVFVEDGSLAQHSRIALILRY